MEQCALNFTNIVWVGDLCTCRITYVEGVDHVAAHRDSLRPANVYLEVGEGSGEAIQQSNAVGTRNLNHGGIVRCLIEHPNLGSKVVRLNRRLGIHTGPLGQARVNRHSSGKRLG